MATNPFGGQGNAFLTATNNLFSARNPQFNDIIKGIPTNKPVKGSDILNQVTGRYVENQAKLKSMGEEYKNLATGGEMADMPLPSATPTETVGNLAPASEAATPTLAAPAYQYDYGTMAPEQRQSTADTLLSSLGADMSLYDPNVTENVRDKYQDLLANFAAGGGATTQGMNTNIYNPFVDRGLDMEMFNRFVVPYLVENAPMGKWPYNAKELINVIPQTEGDIYGQRKALLDLERRNNSGGFMDEMMDQVTNYIPGLSEAKNVTAGLNNDEWSGLDKFINTASNLVAPYIESSGQAFSEDIASRTIPENLKTYAPAVGAGIGTLVYPVLGTVAGHKIGSLVGGQYKDSPSKTALGTGAAALAAYLAGQVMPSSGPVAGPSGGGEILGELGNAAAPATSGWYGDVSNMLDDASKNLYSKASNAENIYRSTLTQPAANSNIADILKNPAMRKMITDILGQMQSGRGQQVQMPYIPPEYAEEATSGYMTPDTLEMAASPLTGGAYTYEQMLKEPAADEGASTPFMSAKDKAKYLKAISKLRAARRAQ